MNGPLLTVDEARAAITASALALLQAVQCSDNSALTALLRGEHAHRGWTAADRRLARKHRRVLTSVAHAGHSWVIGPELDGILAATGLANGRPLRAADLAVIGAQLLPQAELRLSA